MNHKWNLQDIRPATPRPQRRVESNYQSRLEHDVASESDSDTDSVLIVDGKKQKRRNIFILAAIVVIFFMGVFGISVLMQGAEIIVHPKTQQPNLNASIVALRDPEPDSLIFELLTLEAIAEDQVSAQGEEEQEIHASGRIRIFNENTTPQRLIANTRFASPEGNIYRIADEVTIPPAGTQNGETIPGSLTATVTADLPGAEFNINDTVSFTIPGFAENGFDDLFATVYAQNEEPISGGFVGVRYVIDENDRRTTRQALQIGLRSELLQKMNEARPAGTILYQEAVTFVFTELPAVEYSDGMATVREQATLHVPVFHHANLASYLAAATVTGYRGELVRIDNYQDLTFTYTDITDTTDISTLSEIEFTLSGRPLLVWTFAEDELLQDLSGEHKDSLRFILAEHPAIERAEARIRPFWQRNFPTDTDMININEELDK